jgi:L-rhamnose mutarotase
MQRYGSVIEVKPDKLDEYKRLHAAAWPGVLRMIKACNLQNYSIYLRRLPDGRLYLFSYFEYAGGDFAADMATMAADPETQRWWAACKPCHAPFTDRTPDE